MRAFCWFSIVMKKWFLLKNIRATVQKPYPIYDQNGQNQLKSIPYLWPKQLQNHTLWCRTYLYSPFTWGPPLPPRSLVNKDNKGDGTVQYNSPWLLCTSENHGHFQACFAFDTFVSLPQADDCFPSQHNNNCQHNSSAYSFLIYSLTSINI